MHKQQLLVTLALAVALFVPFADAHRRERDEDCEHGSIANGSCVCDPNWKGAACDIPICQNGGTSKGSECKCLNGFDGEFCQVGPCSLHGHVVDNQCSCYAGYKGDYCQDVDAKAYRDKTQHTLIIIILVVVGVILLIHLLVMAKVAWRHISEQ